MRKRIIKFDTSYTIRIGSKKLNELKKFCEERELEYGEFIRTAIQEKMERER